MRSEKGEAAGPGGRPRMGGDLLLFLTTAGATLALELWLAVRRFEFFGRGYRYHHNLDTAAEYAVFFPTLLLCHGLLVYFVYASARRLHRGRGHRLFRFNFLFLGGLVLAGAALAKYRVLAYLSDATDLQTIRNLAGGSLAAALYYVLDEALVLLAGLAAAAGAWFLLYRLLDLRRRPGPAVAPAPGGWRRLWLPALALLVAPILLLQAGRTADTRIALERFNAPWLALALLNFATDFDRDGYSYFSPQRDADPFDGSRHPYALDVPGNGRDEDGLGGDFRYGGDPSALPTPPLGPRPKHVVLIVLESVRAEALSKRFGGRPIAPNLVALAARGSSAPEAWSHVGFTLASLKTLFTGQLDPLPDDPSLFADFKKNGYRVAVFSTHAVDFGGIAAAVKMRENSDVFVDARVLEKERLWDVVGTTSLIVDGKTVLREMDRHFTGPEAWRRPAFLYFNFQSAHFPYDFTGTPSFLPGPPIPRSKISWANREWVARRYWNAVGYADWLTGQVLARLKAQGVLDDSVVLVLGDHGEELFENGYVGHGQVLNRRQMQIPLVSNVRGLDFPRPAGLVDIRRILLTAAGARLPQKSARAVFQYTGTLDRPSAIGLAEAGGRLTAFRLDTEDVTFEDLGLTRSYRDLPRDGELRRRADALIDRWAEERWSRHLRLARAHAASAAAHSQ
ncbi:MAG: hypothetical protein QOJ27_955 [Sphingomonadales bacterium]|nr:hypothetical protein [Sphingomonadales bacterium]